MKYAVVESGGKQYRAVEGSIIDVDRLPLEPGNKFDLERVLLMADGDSYMVGSPAVGGVQVTATVLSHFKGPKVVSFKYRPKKRIRVKGGHRHHYTRLMIDFIGKPGEDRRPPAGAEAAVTGKPEGRVADQAHAGEAPKSALPPKAPKKAAAKPQPAKAAKKSPSRPAARKTEPKKK